MITDDAYKSEVTMIHTNGHSDAYFDHTYCGQCTTSIYPERTRVFHISLRKSGDVSAQRECSQNVLKCCKIVIIGRFLDDIVPRRFFMIHVQQCFCLGLRLRLRHRPRLVYLEASVLAQCSAVVPVESELPSVPILYCISCIRSLSQCCCLFS